MTGNPTDFERGLYGAAQVREMDRRLIEEDGIPGYTLMQRAAAAAFRTLQQRWPAARRLAVLCGSGNNGGDGFEIARLALAAGFEVSLWQFGVTPERTDAARARDAWLVDGGLIARWPDFGADLRGAEVIVDAIFGTGLSRRPPPEVQVAIEAVAAARAAGARVLAIDIPSGVAADTGNVTGAAIRADVTVTFIGNKLGLHIGSGPEYSGETVFDALGADPARFADLLPQAWRLDATDLLPALPRRDRQAHKGDFGRVLIVGGDLGMAGAALLAARGALRAGAGLVSVATRAAHAAALTAAQPEIMFHGVESVEDLMPLVAAASVVAIGPGLGRREWGQSMWRAACQHADLVVDADALNLLAQEPRRNDGWILTPHPGEAARLLGLENSQVQKDRLGSVQALRSRFGGVAVLKGAGSLIAGTQTHLCPYGNPGMAVGGMGDVLTGVIAALRAQGLSAEPAAALGVTVHALAGDRAARRGERGMAPSDLIDQIRAVVNPA